MLDCEDRLALLASQHHASEYNRARFGPQGSPARYLPLSLHLPDHFNQLRQRQLLLTQLLPPWSPARHPPASLHDQIMAAIAEPLSPSLPTDHSLKTSLSHPINISMIIPPDLIALISSHALLSSSSSLPTLLEIPPSFALHRLLNLRSLRVRHSHPLTPVLSALPSNITPTHLPTRANVTDAIHAAVSSAMEKLPLASTSLQNSVISNVSLSSLSFSVTTPSPTSDRCISLPTTPTIPSLTPPLSSEQDQCPPFVIGNLFLSSCPGKKVRLDGPVKGRSGVCRDLEMDMMKMKNLRVGCIVCCLDDSELDFLGAPWPEYERIAKKSGIDVLRLPIPEGLAPISASCLDAHLIELINQYTLQGIPVLVHCRGGVGRAGVVSCCWLIRLGLCGWLDTECTDKDAPLDQKARAFVEKVITLVRRRRSVKAVETYEQVKFIYDYICYLHHGLQTPLD